MTDPMEERLRAALRAQADDVAPSQPDWDELVAAPRARSGTRSGLRGGVRRGMWLAIAAAALALLVPIAFVAGYLGRSSRLTVSGGGLPAGGDGGGGTAAPGPPDTALPDGFSPGSITRISLKTAWVLGTAPCGAEACATLARTRDGGATWHAVPVPPAIAGSGTAAVSRVRFANATDGWLFDPELWATHDGGSTWHQLGGLAGAVTSLEAADGRAWDLVGAGGVSATAFTTPVGSDAWQPAGAAVASSGIAISLHGSSGMAGTPDGAVLALGSGRAEVRGTPCESGDELSALAVVDDTDAVALCAGDAGAGSSTKTIRASEDGGRTWSTAGTAPRSGQPAGLATASDHTMVLAATSGASFLYRSTDAGATWSQVFQQPGGAPLVDLGFTDATHGVVVIGQAPESSLLVSTDAGATWSAQAFG